MKVMKIASVIYLLLSAVTAFGQSQGSGEYDKFNDKWRIDAGAFNPELSSRIRLNGAIITPPPIRIEDILGIEKSKTVPWFGVTWRISQRNSLELEYFSLARDGLVDLIADPIEVGDLIIESGSVNSVFDISMTRLTYGFSLSRSERSDWQVKGGLHIADFFIGMQLSGAVCDVTLGEMPPGCPASQTPPLQSGEVTAPLPHIGVSWAYAITPNFFSEIRAMGFAIKINDVKGGILELSADLVWHPWEHFGVGIGYRYFDINVEASDGNLNGEIRMEYFGPALSVVASF